MSGHAVGYNIEEGGAFPSGKNFFFTLSGVCHGKWIIAIDSFGVHLVRINTCAHSSCHIKPHGFSRGLTSHTVVIVHDVEENGWAAK